MSIIGHSPPTVTATISGTGASFDTSTAQLFDGQPASVTRCTGVSGSQTTSSKTSIQLTLAAAAPVRVLCLLGTTLPAGLKVQVAGKRSGDSGYPYALGGNATTQRLVTFADGTVGAWWVFPSSNDPLIGLEVSLYNDVGGSTVLSASAHFDIGELRPFLGTDVAVVDNLDDTMEDGGRPRRSPNNQPNYLGHLPYSKYRMDLAPMSQAKYLELRALRHTLATTKAMAMLPVVNLPGTTTLDAATMNQMAMYGGTFVAMSFKRVQGSSLWSGTAEFQGYPSN